MADIKAIRDFLEKEGYEFVEYLGNWDVLHKRADFGAYSEIDALMIALEHWLEGWLGVYWYELWRVNEVKQVLLCIAREERYDSIDAAYQWYEELKSVADTTQKDESDEKEES